MENSFPLPLLSIFLAFLSNFSCKELNKDFQNRQRWFSLNFFICFRLQKHQRTPEPHHAAQIKVSTPHAEETVQRIVKDDVLSKKRSEATYQARERQADGRHHMETRRDNIYERKDELKHNVAKASELSNNRYKSPLYKEETIQKREDRDNYLQSREQKADRRFYEDSSVKEAIQVGKTSHRKRLDSVDSRYEVGGHRRENASERDLFKTLSPQKHDQRLVSNGMSSPSNVNNEPTENIHVGSTRKMEEDATNGLKSNFRGGIPPPYVKPRKSKHKVDAEENDTLTFYPAGNSNRAEMLPTKEPDFPDARENGDGMGSFTEIYYKDESGIESTPRRRSHRRRHSRSSSTQDVHVNGDSGKEERVVRRVSTSRRKHETRKGLQVLFDDDHYKKDDEERMIDKLLLHYSKKPSSSDPGKPRRECKNRSNDVMKSLVYKATFVNDRDEEDSTPRKETSRSMSFPPLQVTQPESQKMFARAASLQPETPAKHVHPKLPDYDDLAARFAGLRATKG